METSEIVNVLGNCDLFRGFDTDQIEKIANLGVVETYEPGESIFRQGDLGENLYIIAEGCVSLERSIDLVERKGNAMICLLRKGRTLGCWSTLLGTSHSLLSSAVCTKPSTVIAIRGPALREIMLANHNLGFRVLERICFILRERLQGAYGAMERI
jgi:CRP/FNR family cyclic AMP-dependent transcriptional regulator